MNRYEREAVEFSSVFDKLPYFSHALEIMLHRVLEREADHPPDSPMLPAVISYLKHFPQHLEIVGQCARKTEVSYWKYFFSVVGDPRDLFHQCLANGQLTIATNYLVVVQTLEPSHVSSKVRNSCIL